MYNYFERLCSFEQTAMLYQKLKAFKYSYRLFVFFIIFSLLFANQKWRYRLK